MEQQKITFITTVLNEEKTIQKLLDSLFKQFSLPSEVIVVDGGSTDLTLSILQQNCVSFKKQNINLKILKKSGNRSVGRNEAIKHAKGEIIACSDAGCVLDRNWLQEITRPFFIEKPDVVAGYYKGDAKTIFQKCMIPYVLVMQDQVNPQNFLPASRSMAFRKSIWKKAGGFPEAYSHNEDYVFAHNLKKIKAKIVFTPKAIVYWIPRESFKEAFIMFYRFAYGDAESGLFRRKISLLFLRYVIEFLLIYLAVYYKSNNIFALVLLGFIFYIIWSILKNYRYVRDPRAVFLLPLLQFTADITVMAGTLIGLRARFK